MKALFFLLGIFCTSNIHAQQKETLDINSYLKKKKIGEKTSSYSYHGTTRLYTWKHITRPSILDRNRSKDLNKNIFVLPEKGLISPDINEFNTMPNAGKNYFYFYPRYPNRGRKNLPGKRDIWIL